MIKNAKSLKDKARNIANENAISIQQVLQNYMFERVLERLSKSEYKENFIIKGGLLLSSIMVTFAIKHIPFLKIENNHHYNKKY